MRQCSAIFLLSSLLLSTVGFHSGCKAASWKKADREKDRQAAGAVVEPRRLSSADASAGLAVAFEVDGKSGRPKQSLILRLDYFPETEESGTNLPACYGAFASTFELGVYMCVGQAEKAQPLLAGHIAQDCYTNPRFARIQASTMLKLSGCERGALVLHSFDPPLKIDIEQRETM